MDSSGASRARARRSGSRAARVPCVTKILSIQSSVAYGHVGNSAAMFPLMRMGHEVLGVFTVHFAASTVYGPPAGPMLTPDQVGQVVDGLDGLGVLGDVAAVLSGFQGAPAMGERILASVRLAKERNPEAIYCCDPVMGDVGRGFYALPGIPELLRDEIVPVSDICIPNHFELDFLTGRQTRTLPDIVDAARSLVARGPRAVVVTSAVAEDASPDELHMVAVTQDGAWRVTTPLIGRSFTGSGDVTSAVFLADYLERGSVPAALGRTAEVVYSLLKVTEEVGSRELALVAGQSQFTDPAYHFEVADL